MMYHSKERINKAQSNLIAFLIAMVVIVLFIFGIFFAISSVPQNDVHVLNYHSSIQQQVNGGAVDIYFNASSSPSLVVFNTTSGYKLLSVYANEGGEWVNLNIEPTLLQPGEVIPLPSYSSQDELTLELEAYNTTSFALADPNSTVISS